MPDPDQLGIVLIGHGAPATDTPPQLIGELMGLEWRAGACPGGHHHAPGSRAAELDAQIRNWPRRDSNDPYRKGLEQVAAALVPLLPTKRLAVGYNEFCRPTIAEAIEQVIAQGARRVLVIPSMLTPGGLHSEVDIPRALKDVQAAHPTVAIEYVWPFPAEDVAALLASRLRQALDAAAPAGRPSGG